jgi:TonB family protein
VSSKVDEPGGRDYVAPPSTKWYDGSHQPGAGPATAPDSAPPRDSGAGSGSAPEAKSGTGGPAEHTGTPAGASTLLTRSGGAAGSTPGGTKQVQVSSGVMATNLVESHEPDYPRLAKLSHLEGPVVMEVLISDRGTVDRINVVKGHRLLRGAAMDAVKNWKYRPYTVNGEPVDVSTTVTVNFSLDQ